MLLNAGEVREVGIEIINQLGQDFTIEAAEYEIAKRDGTVVEKGFPMINKHKLLTLFNASEVGRFYITFKYHIGPEILKAKIFVEVM